MELYMNLLSMLTNDPVVMITFGGLAVMFAICSYFVYFFMKNIQDDNKGH